MPKKSPPRPGALQQLRSKGAIGAVAGLVAFGFIASLIAFNDPVGDSSDPKPSPSKSVSETPAPPRIASDEQTCSAPGKRLPQVVFADPKAKDARIVSGAGTITGEIGPSKGTRSLRLDNSQNLEDLWVEIENRADLSGAKELRLELRHNGNLLPSRDLWRVRLFSSGSDFLERQIPAASMSEAIAWCSDRSQLQDWIRVGTPDLGKITSIQLGVPGYGGSGAGNVSFYSALTFSR